MYYLRLLMTEVAWTKDELREALDGEAALSLLITLSLSLSLNSRLRVPAVVPANPSFHTQKSAGNTEAETTMGCERMELCD